MWNQRPLHKISKFYKTHKNKLNPKFNKLAPPLLAFLFLFPSSSSCFWVQGFKGDLGRFWLGLARFRVFWETRASLSFFFSVSCIFVRMDVLTVRTVTRPKEGGIFSVPLFHLFERLFQPSKLYQLSWTTSLVSSIHYDDTPIIIPMVTKKLNTVIWKRTTSEHISVRSIWYWHIKLRKCYIVLINQ